MWYWTNGIEKRHHLFGYRERFRRNVIRNGDLDFKAPRFWLAYIEPLRVSVHLLKSSTSVIEADAKIRGWWGAEERPGPSSRSSISRFPPFFRERTRIVPGPARRAIPWRTEFSTRG